MVTGTDSDVVAERDDHRTGRRVARAAALIAVLTVASRVAGLARVGVFGWSVGTTDLGDIYHAANTIPNIIFEIVAGGALASLVVPLLVGAGRGLDGGPQRVAETVSALLTWVVTLLVPVAAVVAVAAEPLVGLLAPGKDQQAVAAGADMLVIFAPQLPLYGIGIVLTGVLQTYRRFAWPVIAPLLSSLTVIGAYVLFALVAGRGTDVGEVGRGGLLILSVGTTLGVAVLSLCLLIPLRGMGLRLRPRYRMAAETAAAVRRLAGAGAVTVAAQQLGLGLAIALAGSGPKGSVVLYQYALTVFLLPWAVLAVPVATSAYPTLAETAAAGDRDGYARALAPAVRSLVLLACFGSAALISLAGPAAQLLVEITAKPPPVDRLTAAIVGFAPGLPGYALFALLSRALYARGENRLVAGATVLGWAAAAGACLGLAWTLPGTARVTALATGNSVGMTVLGVALLVALRARAGAGCLAHLGRTAVVGVLAAAAATGAGLGLPALLMPHATPTAATAVGQGMLGAVAVVVVFGAVAAAGDRRDTRPALGALVRRLRRTKGAMR